MSFEFDDPTAGKKKKKKASKKIKAGRDVKIKKKKSKKAGRDIIGKKSNVINIKNVMGGKGGGGSGSGGGGASGASGAQGNQGMQGIQGMQGPPGATVLQPSPAPHMPQYFAQPVYQNESTPGFDMSSRSSSRHTYVYDPEEAAFPTGPSSDSEFSSVSQRRPPKTKTKKKKEASAAASDLSMRTPSIPSSTASSNVSFQQQINADDRAKAARRKGLVVSIDDESIIIPKNVKIKKQIRGSGSAVSIQKNGLLYCRSPGLYFRSPGQKQRQL
jgi:hypothetical protein